MAFQLKAKESVSDGITRNVRINEKSKEAEN
jgi:hypothetical protein